MKKNIISDLDIIKHIENLFEKDIKTILYGASSCGEKTLNLIHETGIEIFSVTDSDKKKWGNHFQNYSIISTDELKELCHTKKIQLIITSTYTKEILDFLSTNNIFPYRIYSWFGISYSILMNRNSNLLNTEWKKNFLDFYKNYELLNQYQYSIEHLNEMLEWNLEFEKIEEPLLIYQPGKVGSTTIYDSCAALGIYAAHIHTFHDPVYYCQKEYQNLAALLLKKLNKKKKIKIITMVREPISRDISGFFQTINMPYFYYQQDVNNDLINKCMNAVSSAFIQDGIGQRQDGWWNIPYESTVLGYQFNWFNRNIKRNFNIDIYQYPFDQEKGFSIIKNNNIEILIMQLEKMNQLESEIASFLELDEFHLITGNNSTDKTYYYAYRELINNIQIPKTWIDFYNNKGFCHFYSQEDRKKMISKWKT